MRKAILTMLACVALLLFAQPVALSLAAPTAASARIQDDAGVLSAGDKQSITTAAQQLPYNVVVWTSTAYPDKQTFYNAVRNLATGGGLAIGVDPTHKFSHIAATSSTGLSSTDVDAAQQAANAQFGTGAWGQGLVAALNSLAGASGGSGTSGGTGGTG